MREADADKRGARGAGPRAGPALRAGRRRLARRRRVAGSVRSGVGGSHRVVSRETAKREAVCARLLWQPRSEQVEVNRRIGRGQWRSSCPARIAGCYTGTDGRRASPHQVTRSEELRDDRAGCCVRGGRREQYVVDRSEGPDLQLIQRHCGALFHVKRSLVLPLPWEYCARRRMWPWSRRWPWRAWCPATPLRVVGRGAAGSRRSCGASPQRSIGERAMGTVERTSLG